MKEFTIFGLAIATIVICIGMVSCSTDDASTLPEEPEFYTVKLGWGGEIVDITYEPLNTRAEAGAETDDLYGVVVYSKPNNNSTATSWEPYAYGLFDDPSNISIDLTRGYKYMFKAAMVVDGKNCDYEYYDGGEWYPYPFWHIESTYSFGFTYSQESHGLCFGASETGYLNIESFYGELADFIPGANNADVIISMKRVSFGVKFIAEGALANSGTLNIMMEGDNPKISLDLTDGDDYVSDIFTFYNVVSAWKQDDYSEKVNVTFKWVRPDETELQIGTFPITLKRNTTTVVTIRMENDPVGGDQASGVSFSIDSTDRGEMPVDDDNSVTIIDGEVEGTGDSE